MQSKTAYQFFHDEQLRLLRNKTSKPYNEIQKEIGNKWNTMSPKEKQPYLELKKVYEEQMQRDQQVLKQFQKEGLAKSTRSASINPPQAMNLSRSPRPDQPAAKRVLDVHSTSDQQTAAKNPKFLKQALQKQTVEASQKVIVQKSESKHPLQNTPTTSMNQKVIQTPKTTQQPLAPAQARDTPDVDLREANHKTYLEFYGKQFEKLKKKYPTRERNELTKMISQQWKLMHLNYKLREKTQRDLLKTQKHGDLAANAIKGCVTIEGKEVKVPKKPLSGYMRYYQKSFESIKSQKPELISNQIATIASEKWNTMTEEQKDEYNRPYVRELAEFQRQKDAFIQKYGFFPSTTSKSQRNLEKAAHKAQEKNQKVQQTQKGSQGESHKQPSEKRERAPPKNIILKNGVYVEYPVKLSGYYLFEKAIRTQMLEKDHSMSSRELSAFIGNQWKNFSPENKQLYERRQEMEYQKKRAAFIAKYGEFPEKPTKPIKPVKQVEKKVVKENATKPKTGKNVNELNKKRPAAESLSLDEQEELIRKKIQRKDHINYEDIESEVDDILSCMGEEEEEHPHGLNSLKTKEEDEFEEFEKKFDAKHKNAEKTNKPIVQKPMRPTASPSQKKSAPETKPVRNSLFDMLSQPIQIPDFTFGPNFF